MSPVKFLAPRALVVSMFLLTACGGDKPQEAAAPAPAPARKSEPLGEGSRQLLSWLPDAGSVPGWSRTSEPKRYNPDDLWEYINGAAETFVTYGFQEAATATYHDAGRKLEATIDIYRMGDATGAYGMYAEERNPGATFLKVGAEGYRSGNTLNFWAGPAYVKITSPRETPEVAAALEALAGEVARRVGEAGSRPAVFDRFPAAGLVPHSLKVLPRDVLAQSYLSNGFEGEYKEGAGSWKLVLVTFDADEAAAGALDRYRAFLASSGPAPKSIASPGQGGFAGKDSYYGLIVAARAGHDLGIAVGAPSERQAQTQLASLLKR